MDEAAIHIVGTSHISKHSAAEVRRAFVEFKPDIIAIELDRRRFQALQERAAGKVEQQLPLSMVRQVGVVGYLFLRIGSFVQRKLGGVVKVDPGVDMLEAVRLAQGHGKRLALVDQDVLVTMRRLSAAFTWREKLRVVLDVLRGPFLEKKYRIRLDRVPPKQLLRNLMKLMEERYPSLHRVLLVERNIHMAAKVARIAQPGQRILLVVGAGHEDDLRERLSKSPGIVVV